MTGFAGIQCDECGEQYAVMATPGVGQISPTLARYKAAQSGWTVERVSGGVTRDRCPEHPKRKGGA